MKRHQMLIGGEWVDAAGGQTFETDNPYLGAAWALVPRATPADVDRAVAAARSAFRSPSWRGITATARGALLRRLADLIAAEADRLAEIETRDNGKLITEMRMQLRYIPQWFHYFGGLADKIEGRVIPIDKPGMVNFTREEPLGVVVAITPWNSPLMLATWKLAPALAAGNTVVWKPSEFSSVSALEFGRLFEKAGFPPGVVNILTGFGSEIGDRLVDHPDVAKIAFTGGDGTGQRVYERAARSIKPVTLELGGKSANIVFKDAALGKRREGRPSPASSRPRGRPASPAPARSSIPRSRTSSSTSWWRSAAPPAWATRCSTPRRSGRSPPRRNTRRCSTTSASPRRRAPARCWAAPPPPVPNAATAGSSSPTIFAGVKPDMRIAQEEVFGPVLSVIPFDDEDEAVAIANGTQYGLAAGVWTQSIGTAFAMAERLEAGTVWVNSYRATSYLSPFGGYKRSGIGRESGLTAIREIPPRGKASGSTPSGRWRIPSSSGEG